MNKKDWIIIFIVVIILLVIGMFLFKGKEERKEKKEEESEVIVKDFNTSIIQKSFQKENYLISPYSIEIALNMLREGAGGNTKNELDKVLGNRKITFLNIKDKLNVANALFIKNKYKKNVLDTYYNKLIKDYNSEILYDEYNTPKVINDWVNEKTNGMIPQILDSIDPYFTLGLANAIALDVKWQNEFECNNTRSEVFTKDNGITINAEMMHNSYKYDTMYLVSDDVKGIILPYQSDNEELEFIALLPKDKLDVYINNLNDEKLNKTLNSFVKIKEKEKINLSLPRFTYEYEIKDFINVLRKMGINDAFDSEKANFSNLINIFVYVDDAIHKTKIELNEKGTKAAAVTYFGLKANAMLPQEEKIIDITFNKPFIYLIREKKSNEILFFGTVYEPTIWTKTTCE